MDDFTKILTLDVNASRFLTGLGRSNVISLQESLGPVIDDQDLRIGLQLVRRSSSGEYVPIETLGNLSIILRVFRSNKFATSGYYTVTYEGETSAEISIRDSIWDQQCAINALSTIAAAGGVDLVPPNCDGDYVSAAPNCHSGCGQGNSPIGAFQLIFRESGARSELTLTTNGLLPKVDPAVYQLCAGASDMREVLLFEFREQLLAEADANAWARDDEPTLSVNTVTVGDATTKEKQLVSISPDPAGGSFALQTDEFTTADIPVTASAAEVETAFELGGMANTVKVHKVSAYSWEVEFVSEGNEPLLIPTNVRLAPRRIWRAALSWNCELLSILLANCRVVDALWELKVFDNDSLTITNPVSEEVRLPSIRITRTLV